MKICKHHPLYHILFLKFQSLFSAQMLLKLQGVVNNRVILRFCTDRDLFRVLIAKILFIVLRDVVLFRVLNIRVLLKVLGLLVLSKVINFLFPVCLLKVINKCVVSGENASLRTEIVLLRCKTIY